MVSTVPTSTFSCRPPARTTANTTSVPFLRARQGRTLCVQTLEALLAAAS
ncbi:hypothetical protein ACFPRL_06850 [Pseudoclavibacter helvolus]